MVDGAAQAGRSGASADRIVFLGHATVLIELDGVRLLTDPLLRDRVAHLRRRAPSVEAMAGPIDTALISHLHRDHLDLPSLRLLGRETPLLVPAGAGAWLRRHRFANVTELRVGDLASAGTLEVSATSASHDDRRRPGGPRAEALGYLMRARRSVYFAGDTELFDGMSELGAGSGEGGARLDVALLPVAGWGPTLGPGHMDPLQAAQAAALLNPRIVIPIHWGTLLPIGSPARHRARLRDPPRQFAEHVARLAPGVEVRILAPGEETAL
jgi:L-ascorbate metabolism protein UlaG (beta-lactamase superfamily)